MSATIDKNKLFAFINPAQWYDILREAGLSQQQLSGKHAPCPFAGGTDGFRLDNKNGNGDFYSNKIGSGDGIKLVMDLQSLDFQTALKWIADCVGFQYEGSNKPITMQQKEKQAQKIAAREKARKSEEAAKQIEKDEKKIKGLANAKYIYEKASPENEDNDYLKSKSLMPVDGLRQDTYRKKNRLLMPYHSVENRELIGLETIIPGKGNKRLVAGTSRMGGAFTIKGINDTGGKTLCEGLGTGLSLNAALPEYTILICGAANNLIAVAKALIKSGNKGEYIVAGDCGKGSKEAIKAAQILGCKVTFPVFTKGETGTDFDDIRQLGGIEVVKKQFEENLRDSSLGHSIPGGNTANQEIPPRKENKTPLAKSQLSTNERMNGELALVIVEGKSRFMKLADFKFWDKQSCVDYYKPYKAFDEYGEPIGVDTRFGFKHFQSFDAWLGWSGRNAYTGVIFRPDIKGHKNGKFNLWQGFSVTPRVGQHDLILKHIRDIWCRNNEGEYEYVLNWFARMVQQPGSQGETCITLKSGQGTGKNVILDMFQKIFKNHSTVAAHDRDITGQFNDKLATSVFVFLNEAVWGGSKACEGIMKSLITDETLLMERKFLNKISVNNCTHLVMASNNEYYAALDLDDRRYFTLTLDESKGGDIKYFDDLRNQINTGGMEAFLHNLLERDIQSFNPRVLPEGHALNSAEKGRLKAKKADSFIKWVIDFLSSEGEGLLEENEDWNTQCPEIPKQYLIAHYNKYCQMKRENHPDTDKTFCTKLIALLKPETTHPTKKVRIEAFDSKGVVAIDKSKRTWCYQFSMIEECKKMVIQKFKGDNPFHETK